MISNDENSTGPTSDSKKSRPWYRFILNKYVAVLLFFIVWMACLDNYSFLDHRMLDNEIDELETNKSYYQDEIRKDQDAIRQLKDSDQIERYAREKYYMKRDSEDIYLIEYEGEKKDSATAIPN